MSDLPYHRIAARFYNRPLLLAPSTAETISAFLLSRVGAGPRGGADDNDSAKTSQAFQAEPREDGSLVYHSPRASRFVAEWALDENGRPLPFRRTADGSGVITIVGELVNRGAWIGASSGLVSYEGLKHQLAQAAADLKTKAIVLDIESPGGEAVGAFEAAAAVRAAAKIKPVVAIVNGMAASAGYALASGAPRIVTMPTGISGSIGVVMAHLDYSKYLAEEGVKPTLIFAGAHKVDGNPFEALPEAVRAEMQREVDAFYSKFVDTVVEGRRGLSAEAVRSTEARVFLGEEAVRAGLADSVGTLESVLEELSRAQGRAQPSKKGNLMSETQGAPAADNTGRQEPEASTAASAPQRISSTAELSTAYPALTAAIAANAAAEERQRILDIEAIAGAGHEAMIAGFKADGKTSPEQAAFAILKAEKETRGVMLSNIRGVEAETGKVGAAPPPPVVAPAEEDAAPKSREQAIAEWEGSAKLRTEFPSAETYAAYLKAEQGGKIRRLGRRV